MLVSRNDSEMDIDPLVDKPSELSLDRAVDSNGVESAVVD